MLEWWTRQAMDVFCNMGSLERSAIGACYLLVAFAWGWLTGHIDSRMQVARRRRSSLDGTADSATSRAFAWTMLILTYLVALSVVGLAWTQVIAVSRCTSGSLWNLPSTERGLAVASVGMAIVLVVMGSSHLWAHTRSDRVNQ